MNHLKRYLPDCKDWRTGVKMSVLASLLANLCHRIGKPLPTGWQNLANMLAKSWQKAFNSSLLLFKPKAPPKARKPAKEEEINLNLLQARQKSSFISRLICIFALTKQRENALSAVSKPKQAKRR